jgi:hypothetical protein
MNEAIYLLVHLLTTIAKRLRPGGIKAIITAQSLGNGVDASVHTESWDSGYQNTLVHFGTPVLRWRICSIRPSLK